MGKLPRPAILLLTICMLLVPQIGTAATTLSAYKSGPVLVTSAGHNFAIRYDAAISDPDTQTANAFLNQYIPQLFSLFWEPTNDALVTVHQTAAGCGAVSACATGTDVWISSSIWNDAGTWVHEFTHTLQFSGPVFALRDDPYLFYVEATAFVTAGILTGSVALGGDFAFWVPDWGVTQAIFDYNLGGRGETHVDGNVWMGLYRADNYVFKKLNAHLNQLASQGLAIADIPSFRELIRESIAPSVLDGLPIRQWLAVGGLLAKDEVGNSTLLRFGILSYWKWQTAASTRYIVDLVVDEVSTTGYTSLDASLSKATVYDAVTRTRLADVTGAYIQGGGQNDVEFTVDLNHKVDAVKVDVHIVGYGLVADRSVLIPLYCPPVAGQLCPSTPSDFILIATPDNWLQPLSGTAVIGGANYPIVNGIVAFDLESPTADVSLPVPPYVIPNFLSSNKLTSNSKVMVAGLDYTALQVMQDSDQIMTVSTGKTPTSFTLSFTPHTVDVTREYVTLTVSLNPQLPSRNIRFYYALSPSDPWKLIGECSTDANGICSRQWLPSASTYPVYFYVMAMWDGDAQYLGARTDSALLSPSYVTVIPEFEPAFVVVTLSFLMFAIIARRRQHTRTGLE